jgi:hypothetical protein
LGFGVWGFGVWDSGFGAILRHANRSYLLFHLRPRAQSHHLSTQPSHTPPPHQLHVSFVDREKCAIFTRTIKDALAHKAMLKYADACFVFVCVLAGNVVLISFL